MRCFTFVISRCGQLLGIGVYAGDVSFSFDHGCLHVIKHRSVGETGQTNFRRLPSNGESPASTTRKHVRRLTHSFIPVDCDPAISLDHTSDQNGEAEKQVLRTIPPKKTHHERNTPIQFCFNNAAWWRLGIDAYTASQESRRHQQNSTEQLVS